MKKMYVLLVALSILPLAIDVNAQTEFAPIGAQWCYTDGHSFPTEYLRRYVSEKDTVMDGSQCKIISEYSYMPQNSYKESKESIIFKQDGGKIYYHYLDKFNLLFDFDAKVGEEVRFTFKFRKHSMDDDMRMIDTILSARYIIKSINTIHIDSRDCRTIEAKILNEDLVNEYGMSIPFGTYDYTETIGSDREFIPSVTNVPELADICRKLRCYSDNNISFIADWWKEDYDLPCDYYPLVGIDETEKHIENNFEIYPNPFKEYIYISSKNNTLLTIRNTLGQIVYSANIPEGITEIPTESFPDGVLFIESRCESYKLQTHKIIKR